MNDELKLEAEAFDKRITERENQGFIPDFQNAVKCDYFYKSFWREPKYIQLYLGEILNTIYSLFDKYSSKNVKILDVGCGHGLMSLELARRGFHVDAFDISSKNIELAKKTLSNTSKDSNFGSLNYEVCSFENYLANQKYDIIFFCGSLHHMQDLEFSICKARDLLKEDGLLYCHEPIHNEFTLKDSAQVALIRTLLSQSGLWFEDDDLLYDKKSTKEFGEYAEDIRLEYVLERDKKEQEGQSPNDLESDGEEILEQLEGHFTQLEYQASVSFIYRVLGGLRGEPNKIFEVADFLATYDKFMTKNGFLSPNYFHYIGRKKGEK